MPPAGEVYCEIAPGEQKFLDNDDTVDPFDDEGEGEEICEELEDAIQDWCAQGLTTFPTCVSDEDEDGIPDEYDLCLGTEPGAVVSYCDDTKLGSSEAQTRD